MNTKVGFILASIMVVNLAACGGQKEAVKSSPNSTSIVKVDKNNPTPKDPTKVVPVGTTLSTDLQDLITTGKNKNNDRFTIKVKNNSKYPLLKDAIIEGHLEDVVKAAKGKKASLHLVFDGIKLKNGDKYPLNADLVNTKVETKTKGQFLKNTAIVIGGTVAGKFLGEKTQFKHGGLAGAAAATAFVLSSPGGEVELKKGTDLELKLKSNLDLN